MNFSGVNVSPFTDNSAGQQRTMSSDALQSAVVPHGDRKLRACMVTGLIKTEEQVGASATRAHASTRGQRAPHPSSLRPLSSAQWLRDGNDNVPWLNTQNERELMFEVTSPNFDGMVRSRLNRRPAAARAASSRTGPRRPRLTRVPRSMAAQVAMMQPDESWVARWQGITQFVPGCYALRVRGTLPEQHRITLEENGARYRSLDDDSTANL
jgi:hypothetical protein